MEKELEAFYSELFRTRTTTPVPAVPIPTETPPPFLLSEVRAALTSFPNGKAAGEDKISADFLKACHDHVIAQITDRFTAYLQENRIPSAWKSSKTTLIFKKGDRESLENYRPICVLPVLYKAFTKCILGRVRSSLNDAQPVEQAGFRKGFATVDHIHAIQRLLEAGREYQVPLTLIFIDFHKAFDSVEPEYVWESLEQQGVEHAYINVLRSCYSGCSTTFTPFHRPVQVPVSRGVRQGDPISPNLFSAVLESVFRSLSWNDLKGEDEEFPWTSGVRINGRNLHHLRFADDIVLVSHDPDAATKMLTELVEKCEKVGLKINATKTKCLRNRFSRQDPVQILGPSPVTIEDVEQYIYLGRLIDVNNELEPELHRRRRAAWAAFNNIKNVSDAIACPKLRAQLFDSTVLPALTYGSETWACTKKHEERVRVTHASLERRMVGLTLTQQRERDLHRKDLRKMSRLRDPLIHIRKRKFGWAGHVARRRDDRWTTLLVEWIPRNYPRPRGRPPKRWTDILKSVMAENGDSQTPWSRTAKDRTKWKSVIRAIGEERID